MNERFPAASSRCQNLKNENLPSSSKKLHQKRAARADYFSSSFLKLTKDDGDGEGNVSATNHKFDWLNEEK